ncbi:MAG: hypothetical protein ACKO01_05895, partial [Erythrobacter sp.]
FNNEGHLGLREWRIHGRVAEAITRLDARFVLCEPALTQARYRDLLTKQGQSPELKPSFASDNPQDRLWRAANQWARYDHLSRTNKVREVGERMMSRDRGLER